MSEPYFKQSITRFLRLGIKPTHDMAAKLRIQMVNLDILMGLVISTVVFLASWFPQAGILGFRLNALWAMVSISALIYVVYLGYSSQIGYISMGLGYVFILSLYLMMGSDTEVHFFFLALCMTPMLYFFGNLTLISLLSLFCFGSYIGAEFLSFDGLLKPSQPIIANLSIFHTTLGTIVLAYKTLILIYLYHRSWANVSRERSRFLGLFTHNSIALQEVSFLGLMGRYAYWQAHDQFDEIALQLEQDDVFFEELMSQVRITRVNRALLDLTGAPSAEYYTTHFDRLLQTPVRTAIRNCMASFLRGHSSYEGVFDMNSFQGKKRKVNFSANFSAFSDPSRTIFVFQDITAQVKLEEDLRTNAAFFETLLATVPNPIFYKNLKGVYLGSNRAFEEAFGISEQFMLGKTVADIAPPEGSAFFGKIDREIFRTGEDKTYELPVVYPDKTIHTVRFHKRAFRDGQGNVAGLVGSMIDITDQVQQTLYLNATNTRLRAILESTADGILVVNARRKITHYNQKFIDLWRIPPDLMEQQDSRELLEYVSDQLLHPAEFQAMTESYYAQPDKVSEDTLYFKDGRIYQRFSAPQSHRDVDLSRVWSYRDITDTYRTQQALAQQEQQYRDIVNNSFQAIFIVDLVRMRPVSCNPQTLRIFGCPDEATFFSLPPDDFNAPVQIGGVDRDRFLAEKTAQLNAPDMDRIEYDAIGQRLDGSTFPKRVNVIKTLYQAHPALLFFVADHSAQYEAEQSMRLHHQIIETWVSHLSSIYYRFTREGTIVESIGKGLQKLGLSPEILKGQNIFELFADDPLSLAHHQKVITEGFNTYDITVPGIDGPVHLEKVLFFDPVTGSGVGLAFDVTSRKQTAKALQESEEKFRKLFEHSPFGIAIRDMEANRVVAVNPRMVALTGYNPEDWTDTEREAFTEWEDEDSLNQSITTLLKGEIQAFTAEKKYYRKGADPFWARIHRSVVEINQKTYLIGFIEDIDANRQAEAALRESEARYRLLFEHAFDGIMVFDADSRKALDCNQKLLQYFGIPDKATMLKASLLDFSPLTQPDGLASREKMDLYIREGMEHGTVEYEWLHQRSNGTQMHTYVYALRYQTDQQDLYLVLFRDISAKKEQEHIIQDQMLRLNQKKTELERYIDSNMQLENFAYIASHDLRAPLRAITNFTHLLEKRAKDKLNETEKSYLHFMSQAAENMYSLIDSLLTYSRVDSAAADFKPIDLPRLINLVLTDLYAEIQESQAVITRTQLPTEIYADPTQLRQLFQNLIANAIKFRRPGHKPLIALSCTADEAGYTFALSDNGIGIEGAFFERIFLLFKKLHSQDDYAGTGIGLALCKRVVAHHGGEIWVDSIPEKGTTFFFSLPEAKVDPAPPDLINSNSL